MRESSKRVWAARLLALAVMSLGLSLMVSMAPENQQAYKRRIEIRTTENIGEIINAVEALGRDDINIKTIDESWFMRKPVFLWGTVGLSAALGIILAIYHTIYCVVNGLLGLIKEDDSQLHRPLADEFPLER